MKRAMVWSIALTTLLSARMRREGLQRISPSCRAVAASRLVFTRRLFSWLRGQIVALRMAKRNARRFARSFS